MGTQGVETRLDDLVIGSDIRYPFHIQTIDRTQAIDVAAYTVSFMLKLSLDDLDADAAVEKTIGDGIAISGAYNVDPAVNAQRVYVTVEDVDTDAVDPGFYHWALKRTDPGFESQLAFGRVLLVRGVQRT